MRKVMNLSQGVTLEQVEILASMSVHPVAIKLREHLELWIDDGVPARTCQ